MIKEEIISRMDEAIKEDRERFFTVADSLMFQPKYDDFLAQLNELKQYWRDLPQMLSYPPENWPPVLPDWFPKIKFASNWDSTYIEDLLLADIERDEHETGIGDEVKDG